VAAPAFGAIGTQLQVNPGSTSSVAVPTGVAANDIIVVAMFVDSPAVTVTTTGSDRLLVWSATNWSGGAWTPPTSFTERRDSGDEVMTSADLAQAGAGSSGSITGTCVGNDRRTAFLGALLPVAGSSAPVGFPLVIAQAVNRSNTY
jgi:hypothetical protein